MDFRLESGGVTPARTVPGSIRPVRMIYRFRARRATGVAIRVIRAGEGRTVRRFRTSPKRPGRWHRRVWDGLTGRGRPVPAGRYRVALGPSGGGLRTLGYLSIHSHTFPVDAPHGVRGPVGLFGAARLGGRTHEGFDVTAACGSPLVAVRPGRILKVAWDGRYLGNHVVLKGAGERRTYLYAHLMRTATVRPGQTVRAGRRLGAVGQTGNAGGTPCHLHIEVRSRGRLLDPWPFLSAADR
ncbi:MAG: peptidoglycan DD-metalloendopeptidase family protein [Acidobacteriota bacterium]